MWGGGAFGELGMGDEVDEVPRPRILSALRNQRVVDLACGFYHTACVTEDGSVYTWGWGRDGQLGHGEASATPVRVDALGQRPMGRVACGHHATCALGRDGTAYLWGSLAGNTAGAVGSISVHAVDLPTGESFSRIEVPEGQELHVGELDMKDVFRIRKRWLQMGR